MIMKLISKDSNIKLFKHILPRSFSVVIGYVLRWTDFLWKINTYTIVTHKFMNIPLRTLGVHLKYFLNCFI